MSNEYYDHTNYPPTGSALSSAGIRAELAAIEAAFGKLPTLAGNSLKFVRVNAAGNALEATDPNDAKQALLIDKKGADVASGSSINLDTATGDLIDITGTTSISTIILAEGVEKTVRFTGALTLTHGANLVLPGAANIVTASGDFAVFRGYASGVVRMVSSLIGNQTIPGVKTFSSKPVLPAAAPVGDEAVSARNAAPTFGGRITLTSGTPVTTTDVTAGTTVFFTPYRGNRIPLYDGTGFVMTAFSELSQATTDSTKSPAAVGNNLNYDVFVWNDSGTLRATRGPAWSSDTARGAGAGTTELEVVGGIYVNRFAITNGPSAQRGTYVGTIRSNGSAQIVDSMTQRFVWNNYNRAPRPMRRLESTFNWTYNTSAWRYANNSAANRLDVVRGLDEEIMSVMAQGQAYNSVGSFACMSAIGLDSSTAIATGTIYAQTDPENSTGFRGDMRSSWRGFPGLGFHYLSWIENGLGIGGTTTWEGAGSRGQTGIEAEVMA